MSKELYDACRRYKHFYNKHKDIQKWDGKYHDIDLSSALSKSKKQMDDATNDLMTAMLNNYNVSIEEISIDAPIDSRLFRPVNCECTVNLKGNRGLSAFFHKYAMEHCRPHYGSWLL